jgi:hypothetical protein
VSKLGGLFDDLRGADAEFSRGGNLINQRGASFDPPMSEYIADSLNQRYRATLALVAFLVLLNQLLVQPSLMRLTLDAPVINIAGRQRMLSQRLAKAAMALERADSSARRHYVCQPLCRSLRLSHFFSRLIPEIWTDGLTRLPPRRPYAHLVQRVPLF